MNKLCPPSLSQPVRCPLNGQQPAEVVGSTQTMRCVLVSCCGIPAAGKTTFCRSVVADHLAMPETRFRTAAAAGTRTERDAGKESGPQVRVSHVCFDEHIDRARRRRRPSSSKDRPSWFVHHGLESAIAVGEEKHHRLHKKSSPEKMKPTPGIGDKWKDNCDNDCRETKNNQRVKYALDRADQAKRSDKNGGSTAMEYAAGRSEGDEVERDNFMTTRISLGGLSAAPEDDGENGARWWRQGRQAALAEVEAIAAAHMREGWVTMPTRNTATSATTMADATTSAAMLSESETLRTGCPGNQESFCKAFVSTVAVKPKSAEPEPAKRGDSCVGAAEASNLDIIHPEAVTSEVSSALAGCPWRARGHCCPLGRFSTHVVLVDDNMHFRSMRHEVARLARKYGCGYAQVYFTTSVDLAVERNRTRGTPVAEAVIRKMAKSIQPPDPKRFKWERHTAIVRPRWGRSSSLQAPNVAFPPPERQLAQSREAAALQNDADRSNLTPSGLSKDSDGDTLCNAGGALEAGDDAHGEADALDVLQEFWRVVAAAVEDIPMSPSSVPSSTGLLDQEAAREATRASSLHQFDLQLRECVKRVAERAADARLPRGILRTVMTACSSSRKNAMSRAKAAGNPGSLSVAGRIKFSGKRAVQGREGDGTDAAVTGGRRCSTSASLGAGAVAGGGVNIAFCPPEFTLLERFAREFEEAIHNVNGVEASVRKALIEAASGLG